ncbi:MAG: 1,3-beta-galactosyl-N-acetylhexosamine phosphorylase [Actinomycetaceae bacterium]|nr:1,3-beta-galactosyl-N-acetylhexosamine phosphorylase [Actinomycetaceae bacterium]
MNTTGQVTLPIEVGIDAEVKELMQRLGADAVRNSDGTELPELVHSLAAKVYSTYFPARGDQEWAVANPDTTTHLFLQSPRVPALPGQDALTINVMEGYFADQVAPRTDVDLTRYWQVIDRTTGSVLAPEQWELKGYREVVIAQPQPGHVYTVGFLARQIWDATQMYNYITNNWQDDPTRYKARPYDVRLQKVWDRVLPQLDSWLEQHPEVDVVRFTTFFYHFTLVFSDRGREKFVDWFGYSASVSPEALEAFEAEYGYALTPEDFIDEGYYNCPFRLPSKQFRDWMDFQNRFVTSRVRELTDKVHAAGKEAMMFLGDNWIGTEPYGPRFAETGLDAVVGSVGSAATCRMIAAIPSVKYTEGRFLPYFFPDIFNPEGDPVGEANVSWLAARRAIVRCPLDRIGYGGYLSLALQHPDFVDRVEQICQEFRDIYAAADGKAALTAPVRVAVVNAWGKLRSWQTHMVAHALPYEQTQAYVGVIESLAGLPFPVEFLTFDQVREGALEDVDVLINVGQAGTAFSGGEQWADPQLQSAVRSFVAGGGGLIGVGEPAVHPANGAACQLSDVFGLDQEQSFSLSTDRYPVVDPNHFITDGGALSVDSRGGARFWTIIDEDVRVLAMEGTSVQLAAKTYGKGRSVYFAGLEYGVVNARLFERAIFWAGGAQEQYEATLHSPDPRIEVALYPGSKALVYNSSLEEVSALLVGADFSGQVTLAPAGFKWLDLEP